MFSSYTSCLVSGSKIHYFNKDAKNSKEIKNLEKKYYPCCKVTSTAQKIIRQEPYPVPPTE